MNTPAVMDPFGARAAQVRSGLVLAALGAHLAAVGAVWLTRGETLPRVERVSMDVDWVMPVAMAPAPVPKPAPSPPPRPTARTTARPTPQPSPRPIAAAPAPVLAAAPSPEPSPQQSPQTSPQQSPTPVPMAAAAQPVVPFAATAPATPAASTAETGVPAPAPAAPRRVTLTSTDWVTPPVYAYPREAMRRREQGVVAVRIRFDTQGVPRQVSLLRSSGSAALDAEALARARESRARPRLQDGVPFEFLADTEAEFRF